jgi:hypothetical protein
MKTKTLAFLLISLGGGLAAGTALGGPPVPCYGTVQLTGQSNLQVRQAGSQTFVEFDFTGLHDICLGNGSEVTGTVAGHFVQHISANGFTLHFDEILTLDGGTLGYQGEASQSGNQFHSNVVTVGAGTGPLAGIHGQGTFTFTGPTSFADVIYYVYAP